MRHFTLLISIFVAVTFSGNQARAESGKNIAIQEKVTQLVQEAQNVCDSSQDIERAAPLLQEAARINPDEHRIYKVWGFFYSCKKDWAQAEVKYNQWAKL